MTLQNNLIPIIARAYQKLRHDLEDYIKAQYFGKSPLLLSAVDAYIKYAKPYAVQKILNV